MMCKDIRTCRQESLPTVYGQGEHKYYIDGDEKVEVLNTIVVFHGESFVYDGQRWQKSESTVAADGRRIEQLEEELSGKSFQDICSYVYFKYIKDSGR